MSKTHTTPRVLATAGALAALMIAFAPLASAEAVIEIEKLTDSVVGSGPTHGLGCQVAESAGSWREDCVGVKGNCVGTWGSYGTYTVDSNGNKSYTTTGTYENTYCA